MKTLIILSAVLATASSFAHAAGADADPQCPFIPPGSKSPSTFACALVGTSSCCTQKFGIAALATQWLPNRGPDDAFTLHGLWPNNCNNGRTPGDGCRASNYNDIPAILEPGLLEQMNKYWPSKFDDYNSFWVHEFEKHGTCLTTVNPECYGANFKRGMDANEYFKTGLKLRADYEIYRALKKAGIEASLDKNKWKTAAEIVDAVKKEYGVGVQLKCNSGMLVEVLMYFAGQGRGFVPIELPSDLRHTCGKPGSKIGIPPKRLTRGEAEFLKQTYGYDLEQILGKDAF
jgi:ribonuclease T2